MSKVLIKANIISVAVYVSIGIIGYLIFADKAAEQLQAAHRSRDILEADFGQNGWVQLCRYMVLIAVIAAAPLAVLPAKFAFG